MIMIPTMIDADSVLNVESGKKVSSAGVT